MIYKNEKGLTLIELMVVIVLIGLITVVVGKNVFSTSKGAQAKLNEVRMGKIKDALGLYRLQYNTYPSRLEDLVTASGDVSSSGKVFVPLIDESETRDIFGVPYIYRVENDGRTFSLSSFGYDGIQGGDGPNQDITIRP